MTKVKSGHCRLGADWDPIISPICIEGYACTCYCKGCGKERDRESTAFTHRGVWCCEKRWECKWQCYALHQGLSWGTVPLPTEPWAEWHKRECGGLLMQLIPPSEKTNRVASDSGKMKMKGRP